MTPSDISTLINMACKIATRAAMNGNPLAALHWFPPATATQDPCGVFVTEYAKPMTAADTPPWEM